MALQKQSQSLAKVLLNFMGLSISFFGGYVCLAALILTQSYMSVSSVCTALVPSKLSSSFFCLINDSWMS